MGEHLYEHHTKIGLGYAINAGSDELGLIRAGVKATEDEFRRGLEATMWANSPVMPRLIKRVAIRERLRVWLIQRLGGYVD